jgi:acetyl esterase
MANKIQLEPEVRAFASHMANPPFLFELGPEKGRTALDEVQQVDTASKLSVTIEDRTIEGSPSGQVSIQILRPPHSPAKLPVILYIHGSGWVFGNKHTHDRVIRELAVRVGAAVVFPNYSLSPEAKYPTALEECYAVAKWIAGAGVEYGLDTDYLMIAGDSTGGNLAAALTLLAKERGGPVIQRQVLFYPVTDASFDTGSYHQFAQGYFLRKDAMKWYWEQYTMSPIERNEISASPLRASIAQLKGLPQALIITAEADVVRDEGEAYANKLREAGVRVTAVCFQGTIHDFVMLNTLANTAAARGALMLATAWLREGFEA